MGWVESKWARGWLESRLEVGCREDDILGILRGRRGAMLEGLNGGQAGSGWAT